MGQLLVKFCLFSGHVCIYVRAFGKNEYKNGRGNYEKLAKWQLRRKWMKTGCLFLKVIDWRVPKLWWMLYLNVSMFSEFGSLFQSVIVVTAIAVYFSFLVSLGAYRFVNVYIISLSTALLPCIANAPLSPLLWTKQRAKVPRNCEYFPSISYSTTCILRLE